MEGWYGGTLKMAGPSSRPWQLLPTAQRGHSYAVKVKALPHLLVTTWVIHEWVFSPHYRWTWSGQEAPKAYSISLLVLPYFTLSYYIKLFSQALASYILCHRTRTQILVSCHPFQVSFTWCAVMCWNILCPVEMSNVREGDAEGIELHTLDQICASYMDELTCPKLDEEILL